MLSQQWEIIDKVQNNFNLNRSCEILQFKVSKWMLRLCNHNRLQHFMKERGFYAQCACTVKCSSISSNALLDLSCSKKFRAYFRHSFFMNSVQKTQTKVTAFNFTMHRVYVHWWYPYDNFLIVTHEKSEKAQLKTCLIQKVCAETLSNSFDTTNRRDIFHILSEIPYKLSKISKNTCDKFLTKMVKKNACFER